MAHKIIMLVFNYNPNYNNLEINHINGNKYDNSISNLEWVSHSQNVQHAYDNGLMASGENHRFSILTENQVREICKILESQPRYINQFADLAYKYNVKPITILEIAYGYTWSQISKEYNIDYNNKLNNRFTKEQVKKMCEIFLKFKEKEFSTIFNIICKELNLQKTDNNRLKVYRIYCKKSRKFLQYNKSISKLVLIL